MSVKTIFITGASSGFGMACARAFASEGARLILTARRLDKLEALRNELTAAAGVHVIQLDVRDRTAVDAAIASLPADFCNIDVLVNNAGLALGLEPSHQVAIEDWDVMVDTNIKGLMYCTRAILPGMVARNSGHIVNISSTAASWPYPGGNVYGGTKAFVFSPGLFAKSVPLVSFAVACYLHGCLCLRVSMPPWDSQGKAQTCSVFAPSMSRGT